MIPVPWRCVESWRCVACGVCCKGYQVVLGFEEWVNLIRLYGVKVTQPGVSKFYLGKKGNGACLFLSRSFNTWLCGLQDMKPKACKLWPFKILLRPKFGRPNEAVYKIKNRNLFVYVDPACVGIRWGNPTQEFTYGTLTELVEIATGILLAAGLVGLGSYVAVRRRKTISKEDI